MKYLLIITCATLWSCAAVPIASKVAPPTIESNFTVNKSMDKLYDGLLQFIFNNKYNIKSQFKGESNASIRVEIVNAPISYMDKKTKMVADNYAIAITDVRKRISNNSYVLPVAATLECVFSFNKTSEGLVYVSVILDRTCTLTQFMENYYLEKRRRIPNVEILSTGKIENNLKEQLSH